MNYDLHRGHASQRQAEMHHRFPSHAQAQPQPSRRQTRILEGQMPIQHAPALDFNSQQVDGLNISRFGSDLCMDDLDVAPSQTALQLVNSVDFVPPATSHALHGLAQPISTYVANEKLPHRRQTFHNYGSNGLTRSFSKGNLPLSQRSSMYDLSTGGIHDMPNRSSEHNKQNEEIMPDNTFHPDLQSIQFNQMASSSSASFAKAFNDSHSEMTPSVIAAQRAIPPTSGPAYVDFQAFPENPAFETSLHASRAHADSFNMCAEFDASQFANINYDSQAQVQDLVNRPMGDVQMSFPNPALPVDPGQNPMITSQNIHRPMPKSFDNESDYMVNIMLDKQSGLSLQDPMSEVQLDLDNAQRQFDGAFNSAQQMIAASNVDKIESMGPCPPNDEVACDVPIDGTVQSSCEIKQSKAATNPARPPQPPQASQPQPEFQNAYSQSGFDMLGVLMRVATRPQPQINIGAVDLSCAFVVCDVTQHDIPIVYCSDVFERLTAYTKHEILGRNCRFLQAPNGKILGGVKRKYVDDQTVFNIKTMIAARQEMQISIINYRKGGQPFMNLLTMIPICWDTPDIRYYVGFQVDLVEQPTSITDKNPDGTYKINYQRGMLPRYLPPPEPAAAKVNSGQTINRDDVSAILSSIASGGSEMARRLWDKVLLENTDDVVHVLSLKGLFLYLSPASTKVLEYDATELIGTALSSVCHPSDIVPVTRELKDASVAAAVSVVYRIRRKHSGYTWFESHGALHIEQGKGRKCIIMCGRERPVFALLRNDIALLGGFAESELWTKMSTSGMFLFVSSNARSLLDRQSEDLVGTSAQALMRAESRLEFGRKLELARTGVRTTFKHDLQNRRGHIMQASTTLYPGDATEGQKPTFLIAQTRLIKPHRHRPSMNTSPTHGDARPTSPGSSTSGGGIVGDRSGADLGNGDQSPTSANGKIFGDGITTAPGGAGLMIGSQQDVLASDDNLFDELKTTRSTSWQFELRQMEKRNRMLAEELQGLLSSRKKRKRRNGIGHMQRDCANCHTRVTPEWRRGPSGNRDLCNSCGLRWAKENGRVTPRTPSQQSNKSGSPSQPRASVPILRPTSSQDSATANNPRPPLPRLVPHNSTGSGNSLTTNSSIDTSAAHIDQFGQNDSENRTARAMNEDSHMAKTNRMEAPAERGFAGGIPAKIEEDIEPYEGFADFQNFG